LLLLLPLPLPLPIALCTLARDVGGTNLALQFNNFAFAALRY
jgi:hypothetical protein